MYELIIAIMTIQYLKSKHLKVTFDCSPFYTHTHTHTHPNHQVELFKIYKIYTNSTTATRTSQNHLSLDYYNGLPLISLSLLPPIIYSPHSSQSKLLKMCIWPSHSLTYNQLPITHRIKSEGPDPPSFPNAICLMFLPSPTAHHPH